MLKPVSEQLHKDKYINASIKINYIHLFSYSHILFFMKMFAYSYHRNSNAIVYKYIHIYI